MFDRNFQRIQTNGISLNAVVEGEGPLVVMLHGFPQSSFLWRHQIDAVIDAGFKVAVPDQRGYGESDAPAELAAYNMRELANDIGGIPAALGYDHAIVIGHDFGSIVAWHTALLHEEVYTAVMGLSVPYTRGPSTDGFINPAGFDDKFWYIRYFQEPGVAEAEMEADVRKTLLATYYTISGSSPDGSWMAQLEHPKSSGYVDAMITPDSLPDWLSEEELEYHVAQLQKSGLRGPLNWYRNIPVMNDVTPELNTKKISQPAAFVAGAQDDVLKYIPDTPWTELMKDWFEDLRFQTFIEGAGHWVQVEKPAETTREILRFLEMVRPS
jgi:pimeloyl-ACP methyl ester carboxylesterase